jgi:hypothetical protein
MENNIDNHGVNIGSEKRNTFGLTTTSTNTAKRKSKLYNLKKLLQGENSLNLILLAILTGFLIDLIRIAAMDKDFAFPFLILISIACVVFNYLWIFQKPKQKELTKEETEKIIRDYFGL